MNGLVDQRAAAFDRERFTIGQAVRLVTMPDCDRVAIGIDQPVFPAAAPLVRAALDAQVTSPGAWRENLDDQRRRATHVCVGHDIRLVRQHEGDWLAELREAMHTVDEVRSKGPAA